MASVLRFQSSPKWTFSGKPDSSQSQQNNAQFPGPGHYEMHNNQKSRRGMAQSNNFGLAHRKFGSYGTSSNNPGPADYQPAPTAKSSPSYTLTPRRDLNSVHDKDCPGPGAHNLANTTGAHAQKCVFTKEERLESPHKDGPGPTTYNIQKDVQAGPKWSLGTAPRHMKVHIDTPGPGSYMCASSMSGPKFSAAPRRDKVRRGIEDVPGPVTYTIESSIGKGPGCTMRSRFMDTCERRIDQPGPGHYSQQLKSSTPRYGFGTQMRDEAYRDRQRLPGPGAYSPDDYRKKHIPTCKFGSSERTTFKNLDCPGPGSYNVITTPRIGGPKYTLPSSEK